MQNDWINNNNKQLYFNFMSLSAHVILKKVISYQEMFQNSTKTFHSQRIFF